MTVDSWWSVDKLMMWKDGFTQLSATLRKNCWAMQNTLHCTTLEVAVKRFPFLESLAINPPFSKDCIGYILSGFEKVARGNIFVRERGKHRGGGKHRGTQVVSLSFLFPQIGWNDELVSHRSTVSPCFSCSFQIHDACLFFNIQSNCDGLFPMLNLSKVWSGGPNFKHTTKLSVYGWTSWHAV